MSSKRHAPSALRRELRDAGAHDSEISKLLPIAEGLRKLSKTSAQEKTFRWKIPLLVSGTGLAGLVLGVALMIFSQVALPGNWLYPVQKMSDNAAVALQPSYRGTVMMRRADQVKQLVAERAGQGAVLEALADYRTEAAAYKSSTNNYALFDYCKSDLQQANSQTTGPEHAAITKTLAELQDV